MIQKSQLRLDNFHNFHFRTDYHSENLDHSQVLVYSALAPVIHPNLNYSQLGLAYGYSLTG